MKSVNNILIDSAFHSTTQICIVCLGDQISLLVKLDSVDFLYDINITFQVEWNRRMRREHNPFTHERNL